MTTCKECIHHNVCEAHEKLELKINDICELEYRSNVYIYCKHFKSTEDVVPRREVEYRLERLNAINEEKIKVEVFLAEQEIAKQTSVEIEHEIDEALKSNYKALSEFEQADELYFRVKGKIDALRGIQDFIVELKKKHTGEIQNEN